MSTAKSTKASPEGKKSSRFNFVKAETKVSRYDLVSAMLLSSLVIVGFFATNFGADLVHEYLQATRAGWI